MELRNRFDVSGRFEIGGVQITRVNLSLLSLSLSFECFVKMNMNLNHLRERTAGRTCMRKSSVT